jgi:putative transcriptional regulator
VTTSSLEDILEPRALSSLPRYDAALQRTGIASKDIAATRDAAAAVGLAEKPRTPGSSLRERLLASHARPGKFGVFADRLARFFDLSIADAEALAQRLESPSAFTPFLVDGLELMSVTCGPKCDGAIATVVRIRPGARFPEHAHHGDETMLVLDGGFREIATDEEVWRGEELFRPDGSEHLIEALPGAPCVAAVLIYGHADIK